MLLRFWFSRLVYHILFKKKPFVLIKNSKALRLNLPWVHNYQVSWFETSNNLYSWRILFSRLLFLIKSNEFPIRFVPKNGLIRQIFASIFAILIQITINCVIAILRYLRQRLLLSFMIGTSLYFLNLPTTYKSRSRKMQQTPQTKKNISCFDQVRNNAKRSKLHFEPLKRMLVQLTSLI